MVDITYKGAALKINPTEKSSRLGRLVTRDLGFKVGAQHSGWTAEARAEWEEETTELLGRPRKDKNK